MLGRRQYKKSQWHESSLMNSAAYSSSNILLEASIHYPGISKLCTTMKDVYKYLVLIPKKGNCRSQSSSNKVETNVT